MNYRFQNLLGAPYRGGNVVITKNNLLISPVGNRVSITDLVKFQTLTLPVQSSSDICRLAASPDGVFLLIVDGNRRCLLVNLHRQVVLHRISFKNAVKAVAFSPCGSRIAVAAGKLLQIWRAPGFKKEFFPFELIRTFADFDDKVTALKWSPDSKYILAGSKDLTARLFSVNKTGVVKTKPFLFLGHRDTVVGVFLGVDKMTNTVCRAYTVTRDCYMFSWELSGGDGKFDETGGENSEPDSPGTPEREVETESGNGVSVKNKKRKGLDGNLEENGGKWRLSRKDGFGQAPAKLTACDYHGGLDMLVVGFSNGVFRLYQLPDFICIQVMSISRQKITTALFNEAGNWLTLGCAKLGQLLVWEWRSGTYVFKQQGHFFDANCVAYSADSQFLATGADDNKVKVNLMCETLVLPFFLAIGYVVDIKV
jgi:periodic tryptophan protein 2